MAGGFLARGLDFVVRIGQQILLVPLFIWAWGLEAYGAWLILFGAAGLLSLVEFGMRPYLGNILQDYRLRGDDHGFWRVQQMYTALYLGLGCVVLAALALLSRFFDLAGVLGAGALPGANLVLFILFIAFVFQMMRTPFFVVYRGLGYFVRGAFGEVLFFLATTLVLVGALALQFSPLTTAVAYAAGSAVFGLVPLWVDQSRWLGRWPYGLRMPDKEVAAGVSQAGPMFMLGQLPQRVRPFLPVLLLGMMSQATAAIAQYSVLRVLTMILRRLVLSLADVPGVEMGEAYASGDLAAFRRLHAHAVRLLAGVTGVIAGFMLVAGPAFVRLWALGEVDYDQVLMWTLVGAAVISAPSEATIAGLRYANLPRVAATAGAAQMLLCVGISVLLVPSMGVMGVAIGFAVAEVATQCAYLFWVAERKLQLGFPLVLIQAYGLSIFLGGLSAAVAAAALAGIGDRSLLQLGLASAIWGGLMALPAYFLLLTRSQQRWGVATVQGLIRLGRVGKWWRR